MKPGLAAAAAATNVADMPRRAVTLPVSSLAGLVVLALLAGVARAQDEPRADAVVTVDTAAFGISASVEVVEPAQEWVTISVDRTIPLAGVTIIPRITGARRFGETGVQFEVDAYPRFRGGYLYISAAVSPQEEVFVPFRAALEAYGYPGRGWEFSVGGRYLRVPDDDIVAATGTIGRYFGAYWLSARPTITGSEAGESRALGVTLRRYGAGRHHFVGVTAAVSAGANPDALDPGRAARAPDLHAWSVRFDRKKPVAAGRARAAFAVGLEREEVATDRWRTRGLLLAAIEFLL